VFPEWFIPSHVVLKAQKRPDQGEEETVVELFDTEVEAYRRLKPVQGLVVPNFYGLCHYNGSRALILDHLPGVSLASPEGATLTLEELSALLQPCFRAMHAFGVQHDDPNVGNFQLVDGKIVALDLERVMFDLSEDDNDYFTTTKIEELAIRYRGMQVYYRREGFLEAVR
jgi:hypothetical protein